MCYLQLNPDDLSLNLKSFFYHIFYFINYNNFITNILYNILLFYTICNDKLKSIEENILNKYYNNHIYCIDYIDVENKKVINYHYNLSFLCNINPENQYKLIKIINFTCNYFINLIEKNIVYFALFLVEKYRINNEDIKLKFIQDEEISIKNIIDNYDIELVNDKLYANVGDYIKIRYIKDGQYKLLLLNVGLILNDDKMANIPINDLINLVNKNNNNIIHAELIQNNNNKKEITEITEIFNKYKSSFVINNIKVIEFAIILNIIYGLFNKNNKDIKMILTNDLCDEIEFNQHQIVNI
jgi:hypothetical protein